MLFEMQAVKITKKTYSMAVACLPAGFATYAFKDVEGRYLVINKPDTTTNVDAEEGRPNLTIINTWLQEERFTNEYSFVGKETPDVLCNVKRKPMENRRPVRYFYRGLK